MGPLGAILTPKLSETQAETTFKMFLVWFYIGTQKISCSPVLLGTFRDLDDTLPLNNQRPMRDQNKYWQIISVLQAIVWI